MTTNDGHISTTHIGSPPRPTADLAQAGLGMVGPEIAWAKLEALVEGAAIASERLA